MLRTLAMGVGIALLTVPYVNAPQAGQFEQAAIMPTQQDVFALKKGQTASLAQLKHWPILPPIEFDGPYKGELIVTVVSHEELVRRCPGLWAGVLACAKTYGERIRPIRCEIFIEDEKAITARGYTRELMLRHEIGHCNGWPGDHPGQRPYDGKEVQR